MKSRKIAGSLKIPSDVSDVHHFPAFSSSLGEVQGHHIGSVPWGCLTGADFGALTTKLGEPLTGTVFPLPKRGSTESFWPVDNDKVVKISLITRYSGV